ncbi:hypothetical protein GUJ93_ZPchr0010g8759 [Zizania palustris]|uniref:RRM domain-containing protein n=1 Tax=Zizania palustris TaxID=103762 RepID=A0A8J6BAS0_ZIZPA|nr:hypothetical protein GUJ93_ZPchr0010g8759 [Zizania palustris]
MASGGVSPSPIAASMAPDSSPSSDRSRELSGFGFMKFCYPEDAAVAKQEMNHGGREMSSLVLVLENMVVFGKTFVQFSG